MKAAEIMTADVVSVGPDASTREVAKLLAARGISAVPVVDTAGAPIGMVSEGDLIGRDDAARQARRDWWLTLLAEGEELPPDFVATLKEPKHSASDVMSSPVVTIGESTELSAIAKLLTAHHVKRVPVVRDGRIVGIVSRADLVRALAVEGEAKPAPHAGGGLLGVALAEIDSHFHRSHPAGTGAPVPAPAAPDDAKLSVADFRGLVVDHEHKKAKTESDDRQAYAEQRRHHVAELIDEHISDTSWRELLHKARLAAEQGDREFQLLRFPSSLCDDGGRAINSGQQGWPQTLRGEAAELYLRWERDLKPHGFPLVARMLDFPGGMPGDVGLFLVWGN
jgi:CBS domain-containing protein